MRRPGRRTRKRRALQSVRACNMVDPFQPHVVVWWTTRGGAWAKPSPALGLAGRYRMFRVASCRAALAQERATLARNFARFERGFSEVSRGE